jgi:hypothetical protein
MKTVQLSHPFMEALHTLDLQQVKATALYAEMCHAENASKVDAVIETTLDELRKLRDSYPERWSVIILNITPVAEAERNNDRKPRRP